MINLAGMTIAAAERGLLPDSLVRGGIRHLLRQRLDGIGAANADDSAARLREFIAAASRSPIAVETDKANEQHYEVVPEFFRLVLGPHLKYSCGYWEEGVETLAEAERAGLEITCAHADIADGQRVLDLGCGWGSLSLWIAEHYPRTRVTAVSNAALQRDWILDRAAERGLENLEVITADINRFEPVERFDRVVSIEMFEHMRNHAELLRRISSWLIPDGRLLVHIFCHRREAYLFEPVGRTDWMARYFFSGGMMPADDLLPSYQDDLKLERKWAWNGRHYEQTANAWLRQMDAAPGRVEAVLAQTYGAKNVKLWYHRWRLFFMACAELFGYRAGNEWYVSHYLFRKPPTVT